MNVLDLSGQPIDEAGILFTLKNAFDHDNYPDAIKIDSQAALVLNHVVLRNPDNSLTLECIFGNVAVDVIPLSQINAG